MTTARAIVSIVYALLAASACAFLLRAGLRVVVARCAMTAAQRCATYCAALFSIPPFTLMALARLWRGAEVTAVSAPFAHATPAALPVLMRAAGTMERTGAIVVLLWLAGVALGLVRTVIRVRAARRLLSVASPCGDALLFDTARDTAALMNMDCPRVLISCDVATPAVSGALRPALLLPSNIIDVISPTQARLVIAHELAHVARYDTLVNFAQVVVESIFFFCPFTRAISNELRAERELACDAMASEAMAATTRNASIVLARALERLETTRSSRRPGLALAVDDEPLLRRIVALVSPDPSTGRGRLAHAAFAITCVALTTIVAAAAVPANAVDSTLGLASPAGAFRQDIKAHDDRGNFTLRVVAFRAVGATFDGKPFPADRILQRGSAVRFTSPNGQTMFTVRLQPAGGMVWRSR
jgi:beta-lactamase regulating signal transducer with metallopeptidase domain